MPNPTLVEEVQQLEEEAKGKPVVLEVIQEKDSCCEPNCGPDTCPCS